MSDENLRLPNSVVDVVDDDAPTERAPSVGSTPVPARMRGMALTLLWWRDDEREIAVGRAASAD
jgi:hypothetical protein